MRIDALGIRDFITLCLKTLNDERKYTIFEKFMIHEFAVENLQIYEECETWRKHFFDSTNVTRRTRAKRIYQLFVENNSVFYVNLSSLIRDDLRKKIIVDNPIPLEENLFHQAQLQMFYIMLGAHSRHLHRSSKKA